MNLNEEIKKLIEDRVYKLKTHIGKNYLKQNLLYPEQQKNNDLVQIQKEVIRLQAVHSQIKDRIKKFKEFIPDITEQTVFCAVYLVYGKILQTWEAIFLLSLRGYNFDVMELTRSISENIDLIKVFHLDKDEKYLKQWFEGNIIEHKVARQLEDKFLKEVGLKIIEEHNLSPYDMATDVHRTFSKYTHCSYAALLDSVDVFNEDFDWNGYASTHYTLHNIHALKSAMTATLITLKMTYLELGDMQSSVRVDEMLTFFAGPLDEDSLKSLISKIKK